MVCDHLTARESFRQCGGGNGGATSSPAASRMQSKAAVIAKALHLKA